MQVVEGQQVPAVVSEAVIDFHQPQLAVGRVAKFPGQVILAAVHHAGVQEGGEGVDLVADGDVVARAGRAGAEEGDAVPLVLDSRVIGWDLYAQREIQPVHQGRGVGRSGSPPVHPPEGLDPTSEAACSQGPEGETQTPKQGPSGLLASSHYRGLIEAHKGSLSEVPRAECL